MKKPQPKKEMSVRFSSKMVRHIRVWATTDAAQELVAFGNLTREGADQYYLIVDARYDFDEVLAYIQGYG